MPCRPGVTARRPGTAAVRSEEIPEPVEDPLPAVDVEGPETLRWQALMRDRTRSALTMLGIGWGLVSVVLLLAYGQGLGGCVLSAFLNMGNNVIVMPAAPLSRDDAAAAAAAAAVKWQTSYVAHTVASPHG